MFNDHKGRPRRKAGDSPHTVPVSSLSIFDPIFLGIDENAVSVTIDLPYRNLLVGGEPGGGKSVLLNNIVGHAVLCSDVTLALIDGKEVELGMWRDVVDVFVGANPERANALLRNLQSEMDRRYDWLLANRRRKIEPGDGMGFLLVVIDEIAVYTSIIGTEATQKEFLTGVRDLVSRGRAAGIMVVAATQRPSADIVPTNLRDIFGYRCAFRCTTDASSDIILGTGWAKEGYNAKDIPPEARGVGWLLAEGGLPRRFKGAYLTDHDITEIVQRGQWIRHHREENGDAA